MEKLTTAQQQLVKKMSNDRLRDKLIAAGYDEEIVMDMDREVLQSNYAEILITGGDAKSRVGPTLAGYDPDVEREKLAFEQKKWEAEQKEKRQLAEERRRKEELEFEQLKLKQRELDLQAMRGSEDRDRRESAVIKGELFGDAIHNSAIKMGHDPIELVSFLRNCEQLFDVYDVPASLQAILIRSLLNEKARDYVAKLDPEISGNYQRLKAALLSEFKLSPNLYLERFNACVKTADDTYVTYASKLTGLLDYYLESRKITALDELKNLLVCDKIKSTLKHVCVM